MPPPGSANGPATVELGRDLAGLRRAPSKSHTLLSFQRPSALRGGDSAQQHPLEGTRKASRERPRESSGAFQLRLARPALLPVGLVKGHLGVEEYSATRARPQRGGPALGGAEPDDRQPARNP